MALTAKPYLRSLSIRDEDDIDTSRYPFSIAAVRNARLPQPLRTPAAAIAGRRTAFSG
jgi:predicted ATPase